MSSKLRGFFGLQKVLNFIIQQGERVVVKRRGRRLQLAPQLEALETREVLALALGINLEQVTDYMAAWMFTDAFKESRPWIRTTNGNPDFSIALDANGYPVQLTTGQQVQTLMFDAIGNHYPSGLYTAWWQGDGTVNWSGDVNPASIQLSAATGPDGQQYHVAQFTVTPGSSTLGIYMTVGPSSPVDSAPIHDVHVWMPDYNGQSFVGQIWRPGASFSPFHPLFLQRLAPFHTLRFDDLVGTETVQHWSDRRPWNYATQQIGDPASGYPLLRGMSPEYAVELANEVNADLWINIPHLADYVPPSSPADSYLLQLANLVHNTLHPNLHVDLEYSNEIWNSSPGFGAYPWVVQQLGGHPTQDQFAQFVAQQQTRVFGVWSQAFSDRPGQLIRVLSGQEGGDYYNGPLLAAMNHLGGNYDAFAVGAYIHAEPFHANTTVDQVLADTAASIPVIIASLQGTRALVNQSSAQLGRRIAYIAYEGGPGLESQFFPSPDPTLAQDILAMNQAMLDPRMYGIYSNFLNQLGTTGLELLNHEQYTGRVVPNDPAGLYGALNYQDQAVADAHRYRALLDYLAANGVQFSAASYSVSKNGASATITLTRGTNNGASTVNYATSNGTAVAGVRYTATSGTLIFAPGETSKTFSIPILNNNVVDGNQTVNLTLSNPTNGATLGSQNTAVLIIVDTNLPQVPNGPRPANLGQVATFFAHSLEHYTDFVTKAYLQYLGRGPDAAGLAAWVNAMLTQGLSDERLEAGFIGSTEYVNNHGGPGRGWIVGLYRDLLGRTPAESEINSWLTALANGATQFAVAYGFAASAEREGIRVRTNYLTYLGRDASATEINGWVQAFLAGASQEDLVAVFVGSPEYYANPQKGNGNRAVWVSLAYMQVLFRAPTIPEVNSWVAVLN